MVDFELWFTHPQYDTTRAIFMCGSGKCETQRWQVSEDRLARADTVIIRDEDAYGTPGGPWQVPTIVMKTREATTTIYCYVYDSVDSEPLNGASVVRANHINASTSYDAFAPMEDPGKYFYDHIGDHSVANVIITHAGYTPDTIAVQDLKAGETTSIASYLVRSPPAGEGFSITTASNKQAYHLFETVYITVMAVNNADTAFSVGLGSGCRLLYYVLNAEGERVYPAIQCTHIVGWYQLMPYENDYSHFEWNLDEPLNSGQPVSSGAYLIYGYLRAAHPEVCTSDTIAIQVIE
ncbi:hypothetical protein ACFL45_06930 [Candidatus Neomarinimicrobiota bacterium]